MDRKTVTIIIIGAVIILAGGAWAWSADKLKSPIAYINSSNDQGSGTVYIAITDAAMNMENVSKVTFVVDKIYLHSEDQGWVTISEEEKTFELLELKESKQVALAVTTDVKADAYDQIWLHVAKVTITESGRQKTAILPSNDIKMDTYLKVNADAKASAVIDIIADESLHKTAKGEIIFAPVILLETRSNTTVQVDEEKMVQITGGTVGSNMSAGMDVDGQVKNNFKLAVDSELVITTGTITIKESESE